MNDNDLRVIIYSSGTTVDTQFTNFIKNHGKLRFDTIYPGGLYSVCSFFVGADPTDPHPSAGNKRIEILNGLKVIWEGIIDVLSPTIQGGDDGYKFECTGQWGALLGRSRWNKVWCDTRTSEDKWIIRPETQFNMFHISREDCIRATPVNQAFASGDSTRAVYYLPAGQTVNRVVFNYNLQEAAQNWAIYLWDWVGGTAISTINTSGTGTTSGTPAAGCGTIFFSFNSGAAQTPTYSGSIFLEVSNVKLYTEAGSINPTEVFKDVVGQFTALNSDTSYIASNTLTVEPCYMEWETIKDFVTKITTIGDASYNPWAVGVLASSEARTPDGKPVLYYEQQPALSGYDYVIRLDEFDGQVTIDQVFDEIINRIAVEYTDAKGRKCYYSYISDATLEDTTSQTNYGTRYAKLNFGNTSINQVLNYARRYLAWFKDPKWRMASPIKVKGTIRTQGRNRVPVCWVRAGQRVMIENYLQEMDGSGITFLITATSYDEDAETLTITAGSPDPLSALIAQMRK